MNRVKMHFGSVLIVMASLVSASAIAEIATEEAKQLGGPMLTLFGAEKAGNKEGTIPAYTGAGVKAPPSWDPINPGQRPDPYGEKPLFAITAQNAAQYADKLDGAIELFKRYPNFRMDVYPSHRDWVFPQYVLDNTVKNATACKAANNGLALDGCYGGLPFPIPKTGNEAMWNHLVTYVASDMAARLEYRFVPAEGEPYLLSFGDYLNSYPFYDASTPGPRAPDTVYYRTLEKTRAPAHRAGNELMIIDSVDPIAYGRRAYIYVPGKRWVKLAAEMAYDTLNPNSGGIGTLDENKGFYGALDRYDFKLLGKKEKFIYYDNFSLADEKACSSEKLHSSKNFPHPDCVRWELHRVWVVKATLKPSFHHIFYKRVLYWDEDGFAAGMAENYDAAGKLQRIVTNALLPFFEAPGGSLSNFNLDLKSGAWTSQGSASCPRCGRWPLSTPIPDVKFTPEAMAGGGIR